MKFRGTEIYIDITLLSQNNYENLQSIYKNSCGKDSFARYGSENNLSGHQINYVERIFKRNDKAAKKFNILAISVNVLHIYLDDSNKIIFRSV